MKLYTEEFEEIKEVHPLDIEKFDEVSSRYESIRKGGTDQEEIFSKIDYDYSRNRDNPTTRIGK